MLAMDQIHLIRQLYYEQGIENISEIAKRTGYDWKTVQKYIDMEDFSPSKPNPEEAAGRPSKLDPYKPLIDGWLIADKKAPRKQRHTAQRVFERLCRETSGFNVSYRTVAKYVAVKKEELKLAKKDAYVPLIHEPGTAQCDFGTADFSENTRYCSEGKYLVLSFPSSNGGYLQLFHGENMECLLEGLQTIFHHIGGVPTEIWFDNTKTIVTDIIMGGGRTVTERFQRFAEHYRFRPVFMNPAAGWEKGNVENKVGYLRRHELVPVPSFSSLTEENKHLLMECDANMDREHYQENIFISELFEKDKDALLPLPSIPFDTAKYMEVKTDKYGKFTLNHGKHCYSASPDFCASSVQLKLTSQEVIVLDRQMNEVVCHKRLYGDTPQESMDWIPYLKLIARKPRSLRNSGLYDMMPVSMQQYMDMCSNKERGQILRTLAELTDRSGFDSAVKTVEQAIRYNATDPDSLKSLHNRVFSDVPVLPPLNIEQDIPRAKIIPFNRNELLQLDAARWCQVVVGY